MMKSSIRWAFGMFVARVANRILPQAFRIAVKLNITQKDIDRAFEEKVEAWNL